MTRALASAGLFAVLAFTVVGQAFAVSGTSDSDAALRAMMDDAPHRPAASSRPQTAAPEAEAPAAPNTQEPSEDAPHGDVQASEEAKPNGDDARSDASEPAPAEGEAASGEESAAPADAENSAEAPAEAPAEASEAAEAEKAAAPEASSGGSWLSKLVPSLFGGGEEAKAPAPAAPAEEASQDAPAAEGEAPAPAEAAAETHEATAEPDAHASEGGEQGAQEHTAAAPDAAKESESGGGWMSYIPFFGSSSKPAEASADAKPADGGDGHEAKADGADGEHAAAPEGEAHAGEGEHDAQASAAAPAEGGEASGDATHGDAKASEHGAPKAAEKPAEEASGGGWMSYIPFLGGGSTPDPKDAKHADAGKGDAPADSHDGAAKDGKAAEGAHGEAPAEGHGAEAAAEGHAAEGEGHGEAAQAEGEHGEGPPPPPPLWPDTPAVEESKQPFVRVRQLRRIQDQVAKGSIAAYDKQKTMMRDLSEEFRALPPEVWDDTRNVRAAVYFVLTGGDPRVLYAMLERETPIYVPRRLIRGALAYGEGRTVDAKASLDKVNPDQLAPELQGLLALIRGTLLAKNEPKKAIEFFDKARLFAPGTLVEESALRQQILLVATEGNMERFDFLSSAYARRFPRSLFARNFRRQLFAGIAKQVFKGEEQWIARTETEMQRLPPGERAGLYLSIAEEATKGGHIKIAQFAAAEAAKLYPQGSKELDRARLYEGAVLVATVERDRGVELLSKVRPVVLKPADKELYDAAQVVASSGRPRAVVPRDQASEELPASVVKAADLLKSTEALLTEESQ